MWEVDLRLQRPSRFNASDFQTSVEILAPIPIHVKRFAHSSQPEKAALSAEIRSGAGTAPAARRHRLGSPGTPSPFENRFRDFSERRPPAGEQARAGSQPLQPGLEK
jgi:hypothetical protein